MASILKRGKKYRALVRKKGMVRCHTFQTKSAAKTWAIRIEAELDLISSGSRLTVRGWTVGDVIDRYVEDVKPNKQWGVDKDSALKILKIKLGSKSLSSFGTEMVLAYARERLRNGVGGSTISGNLSYLSTVVKYARNALRLDIPVDVVSEARSVLVDNGLMTQPKERERRPTEDELKRLKEYYLSGHHVSIPMPDIIDFAIHTGMRRGEICRIQWTDLDTDKRTVIIRDRKHPRKKLGNHQTVPLLNDAFGIVMRQPRIDDRIFPYVGQSIGNAFTLACRVTGIEGLHFHDLRHHALSILFEQGYQIQEVALVSGHSSWDMLKRYTHIKPESLHRRNPTS